MRTAQIATRYLGLSRASAAKSRKVACGLPERRSMLVAPGGQEVIGVVDFVTLVEIDDPPDAELVAVGFGDRGMRCEDESVRHQDQVVGDPAAPRQGIS